MTVLAFCAVLPSGQVHAVEPTPCKILIYSNALDWHYPLDTLKAFLEGFGNTVRLENRSTLPDLTTVLPGDFSQFWFVNGRSSASVTLTAAERDSIISFAESGRGLAILGDHSPAFAYDANYIANHWGVSFVGWRDHSGTEECDTTVLLHYDHPIAEGLASLSTNVSEGQIRYTGSDSGFRVVSEKPMGTIADTLQATFTDGVVRVFFDASFVRYLDGHIVCCRGRQLVRNIACWLEPDGCSCIPAPSVDSVWLWEETDCDGRNIVHICYNLSGASASVGLRMSADSGATWGIPLASLWGDSGDVGAGVEPGTHCLDWIMDADAPGMEGYDWLLEVFTNETLFVDSFAALDTTEYSINGNDGFVAPDSDYFVLTQNLTWRNGRLMTTDTFYIDTIAVDFDFKFVPGWCDVPSDSTGADGMSLIFSRLLDPPLSLGGQLGIIGCGGWGVEFDTYNNFCGDPRSDVDGNHIAVSVDDTSCLFLGSEAVPLSLAQVSVPFELADGAWHHASVFVAYPRCRVELDGVVYIDTVFAALPPPFWAHVGFSASTGDCWSEQVIDNLVIRRPISVGAFSADTGAAPLDSRPPRVEFLCPPESAFTGDTVALAWSVDDLFWRNDPGTLLVASGPFVDTFIVADTTMLLPLPGVCGSVWTWISVRDSFCNWGGDSCGFLVCPKPYALWLCPACGAFSACSSQTVTLAVVDSMCEFPVDSAGVYLHVVVKHEGGESDTFAQSELSITTTMRGDTSFITIGGIPYSDGDTVTVMLDSIFNVMGCPVRIR